MKLKRKAFTLIELLVVMSIIGILASIMLVGIQSSREKSKTTKAKTDVSNISLAVSMLYADTRMYPADGSHLQGKSDLTSYCDMTNRSGVQYGYDRNITTAHNNKAGIDVKVGLVQADPSWSNWSGPYYKGNTVDPWGNDYQFSYCYQPKRFINNDSTDPKYNTPLLLTAVVSSGQDKDSVYNNDNNCDDVYKILYSPSTASINRCPASKIDNKVE